MFVQCARAVWLCVAFVMKLYVGLAMGSSNVLMSDTVS